MLHPNRHTILLPVVLPLQMTSLKCYVALSALFILQYTPLMGSMPLQLLVFSIGNASECRTMQLGTTAPG